MSTYLTTGILVLDKDPVLCAQYHTDIDLRLTSDYAHTLHLAHAAYNSGPQAKHVLAKWALQEDAWWWLARLVRAMLEEQWHRFEEQDDAALVCLASMLQYNDEGPVTGMPRFLQLIPDKIPGNPVEAYRKWYHTEASASWTNRGAPPWWEGNEQLSLLNF